MKLTTRPCARCKQELLYGVVLSDSVPSPPRKYDGSRIRRVGRPQTAAELAELIVRMAKENPGWGYTRIRGALRNLKHEIGRNTIKRILLRNGLEPATGRQSSWGTFLKAHWGAIAATDFFSVEVLTWSGLVRYFVLFVIDLEGRRELSSVFMAHFGECQLFRDHEPRSKLVV